MRKWVAVGEPWNVQVVEIRGNEDNTCYMVCQISNLFPEGIDQDSAATAFVKLKEFFWNKTEAEEAYRFAFLKHIDYMLRQISEDIDDNL